MTIEFSYDPSTGEIFKSKRRVLRMATIKTLLARRDKTTPGAVLADDSLNAMRYECLSSLSPYHFLRLHRSAILAHASDETFKDAFNRMVDVLILTQASDERTRV